MTSDIPAALPSNLTTESVHPASICIDTLSPLEIVRLINAEDATIAAAVARESEHIAQAIEVITERIRKGGRLVYVGAGTSGRLGVLDASECPPTFNTPPDMVVGLIAGGDSALRTPAEGIEDLPDAAVVDLRRINFDSDDVLVGIATSGRTPYVIGALQYARDRGAYAIGLACNDGSPLAQVADLMITPIVGPEIISGSTRMKAGTATKMILNMLSTATMVQLGKTYGNLMVDLRATNSKLLARSRRLVATLTDLSEREAEEVLGQCDGELKTAVVMVRRRVDARRARQLLQDCQQQLRSALQETGDGAVS